jgi:hypothetical protein
MRPTLQGEAFPPAVRPGHAILNIAMCYGVAVRPSLSVQSSSRHLTAIQLSKIFMTDGFHLGSNLMHPSAGCPSLEIGCNC